MLCQEETEQDRTDRARSEVEAAVKAAEAGWAARMQPGRAAVVSARAAERRPRTQPGSLVTERPVRNAELV